MPWTSVNIFRKLFLSIVSAVLIKWPNYERILNYDTLLHIYWYALRPGSHSHHFNYLCQKLRISFLAEPSSSHAFANLTLNFSAFLLSSCPFSPRYKSTVCRILIPNASCSLRCKSTPVHGLETLSGPYLDEFESYFEIFCVMCGRNWLICIKGPANSTNIKVTYNQQENLTREYHSQKIQ